MSALRRLEAGDSVVEVARYYRVDANALRRWRREYQRAQECAFPGPGRRPGERGISELRRQIEQHAQQIDYLKLRIQSTEAQCIPQAGKNANDSLMA
jgi:transposase-like protein